MEQVETKVDVLAVMDRQIDIDRDVLAAMSNKDARWVYEGPLENFIAARAAIAELIEADKEYDAADSAWGGERYERDDYGVYGSEFWRCLDCENESGAGVLNKGVTHEQGCRVAALERAIERRDAALARVGGGK